MATPHTFFVRICTHCFNVWISKLVEDRADKTTCTHSVSQSSTAQLYAYSSYISLQTFFSCAPTRRQPQNTENHDYGPHTRPKDYAPHIRVLNVTTNLISLSSNSARTLRLHSPPTPHVPHHPPQHQQHNEQKRH